MDRLAGLFAAVFGVGAFVWALVLMAIDVNTEMLFSDRVGLTVVFALFLLAVVLFLSWFDVQNELVRQREDVEYWHAVVETRLQQRRDLVPDLVQTIERYVSHENLSLTGVAEMRARATTRPSGEDGLNRFFGDVFSISEQYPELRADVHFVELCRKLSELEDQIQEARQKYNDAVREHRLGRQQFPGKWLAMRVESSEYAYFASSHDPPEDAGLGSTALRSATKEAPHS